MFLKPFTQCAGGLAEYQVRVYMSEAVMLIPLILFGGWCCYMLYRQSKWGRARRARGAWRVR